jgi:hypothetical protein
VTQHLAAHRLAAYTALINRDFFGARVHFDHAG